MGSWGRQESMNIKNYVLGVDGGNSKTDYLLFDTDGQLVDHIRAGTCSHEALKDGYDGARRVMGEVTTQLLSRNGLTADMLAASVFGLAGVDVPKQQKALEEIVSGLGFKNTRVMNDSFLGIKGGSLKGVGVCSINGTGTVAGGIDETGAWLQVGGLGFAFGDEAGGSYLAQRTIRVVYDALFRCGPATSLSEPLMALFGITDKRHYTEAVTERYYMRKEVPAIEIIQLVFRTAGEGDAVAIELLTYIGTQLARSAAGCVNQLRFGEEVDIILAGSVWVKATDPTMFNVFKQEMARLTGKACQYITLDVPPAVGAVLWALELANGQVPGKDVRTRIWESFNRTAKP